MHSVWIRLPLVSLAITFLIVLLVCISPIRWDIKSIAPVLASIDSQSIPLGTDVLFVSPNMDWKSGHIANYGLDFMSFPYGNSAWVVFKEGFVENSWSTAFLIDKTGNFYQWTTPNSWQMIQSVPERLQALIESGIVLVPSQGTKAQLVERWPALKSDKILVLKTRTLSFLELPRLRINGEQFLRIFTLTFILVVSVAFSCRITVAKVAADNAQSNTQGIFSLVLALPCLLAIHTILVFFLGKFTSEALTGVIGFEFIVAVGLLRYVPSPGFFFSLRKKIWKLGLMLVLIYFFFAILRLDFDGDLLTHWLPMARFYYLLGDHNLEILLARYGGAHEVTYPPGFPILISTLMWAGGMDREASFQLGYESHLVIFLYRLVLITLSLSFLLGMASLFRTLQKGEGLTWLLPGAVIPFLLPLFLGKPTAGEIYLVPMMGFSILALLAGDALNQPAYSCIGLFLGAFGMFIKNDMLLIFPLIILPWYLAGKFRSVEAKQVLANSIGPSSSGLGRLRSYLVDPGVMLLGLAPFLLWKLELSSLNIRQNFMFEEIGFEKLVTHASLLARLFENAFKILLANNYWIGFFLILPGATLYNWFQRRKLSDLFVPAGIFIYLFGMIAIYVFSHTDPLRHMDVSYERLVMIAVLSGIFYGAKTLVEG